MPVRKRFVRSTKKSCQDRMIFIGEGSLRKGIDEFVLHYPGERNHSNFVIHDWAALH
jgi:hypothetical protein